MIHRSWVVFSWMFSYTVEENLQTLLSIVQKQKGIELAEEKMREYQQKALELLLSFPESEVRQSLLLIINYVSERKK